MAKHSTITFVLLKLDKLNSISISSKRQILILTGKIREDFLGKERFERRLKRRIVGTEEIL